MDERSLAEVVEALRSAARALRAAEQVLLRSPTSPSTTAIEPSSAPQTAPALAPAEKALLDFLTSSAADAKVYEEQDPQSFRVHFDAARSVLADSVLRGDMLQSGPDGTGAVSLDNTPAATLYEACLKAMRENNLHATDIVVPFVERAGLKNWGDVDVDTDLVIMRYETPGEVTAPLAQAYLQGLVEAARATPGALDRCRSTLATQGIRWEVSDAATGALSTELYVSGVHGQWAACVDVQAILRDLLSRLSVIEVDYAATQQGWWDSARADSTLPQILLPIVRGKEKKVVCLRNDISSVESWASGLPGWYEGKDTNPTPIVFRDAISDDILS